MIKRDYYLIFVALLFGVALGLQSRSYETVNASISRDNKSNIFQEITILKEKNEALRKEIEELEGNVTKLADQNQALASVKAEIEKYQKISGRDSIFGSGVEVQVKGKLKTTEVIDLVNDFFNSGAEAISVNGIRIANDTVGFDSLPQGQVLINGSILTPPYIFQLIGDPSSLLDILQLKGGIFDRLKASDHGIEADIKPREVIKM